MASARTDETGMMAPEAFRENDTDRWNAAAGAVFVLILVSAALIHLVLRAAGAS